MKYQLQRGVSSTAGYTLDMSKIEWKTVKAVKTKLMAYRVWEFVRTAFQLDTVGFEGWQGHTVFRLIEVRAGKPPTYSFDQYHKMQAQDKSCTCICEHCGALRDYWMKEVLGENI